MAILPHFSDFFKAETILQVDITVIILLFLAEFLRLCTPPTYSKMSRLLVSVSVKSLKLILSLCKF